MQSLLLNISNTNVDTMQKFSSRIDQDPVCCLNDKDIWQDGSFVLYWMEVQKTLKKPTIKCAFKLGKPVETVAEVAEDAACSIMDREYLHHQRRWRRQIAKLVDIRAFQVLSP